MKNLLYCALIAVFLSSCVVTANLDLSGETGTSENDIKATDFFNGIIEDLSSFKRDSSGLSLMDLSVKSFEDLLKGSSEAYDVSVTDKYDICFSFDDFNALVRSLSSMEKQSVLFLEDDRLVLDINIDNYAELKRIVPFLAQEDIEVYCAEYNRDYSEDDYLTMMEYIAGPQARDGILSSYVSLLFSAPSEIKTTNGKKINSTQVEFTFPLIDFLLLQKPVYFFCEF